MLLQANRRAELLQLAVDGFLTLVVAGDTASVTLSRTTRARFLRTILTKMKVEKRSLRQEDVVAIAAEMAKDYGYDINPTAFVTSFFDSGILHLSGGHVVFSLPFVKSYLLALELSEHPDKALQYFDFDDEVIDLSTFDIYCEIKPSAEVVNAVIKCIEGNRDALVLSPGQKHILLTDAARPSMIAKPAQLKEIENRFHKLSEDVRTGRGDVKRKQKLLDMIDRVREAASDRSGLAEPDKQRETPEEIKKFIKGMRYWVTGTQMLGSAAEHLRAETKEHLSAMLVQVASLLAHVWTEAYSRVDFKELRAEFTADEKLSSLLNGSESEAERAEIRRQVESLVDLLEFSVAAAPLRRLLHHLCERARLGVLTVSIERSQVEGKVEKLVHALWLADIHGKRGHQNLMQTMKDLPASPFLQIVVATHLMTRVYWNQSDPQESPHFDFVQ